MFFLGVSNSGNLFSDVMHGVTVFIGAVDLFLAPRLPKTAQMILQQNFAGQLAYNNRLAQEVTAAKSTGDVFDDIHH